MFLVGGVSKHAQVCFFFAFVVGFQEGIPIKEGGLGSTGTGGVLDRSNTDRYSPPVSSKERWSVQGSLAHKKTSPPRTLQ